MCWLQALISASNRPSEVVFLSFKHFPIHKFGSVALTLHYLRGNDGCIRAEKIAEIFGDLQFADTDDDDLAKIADPDYGLALMLKCNLT